MSTEKNQTAAPSLVGQLDTEYVQAAQADRAQRVKTLRELAARGNGTLEFYKTSYKMMILVFLSGLAITLVGAGYVVAKNWGPAGLMLAGGVLCLVVAISRWLSRKKPSFTFGSQGILFTGLTQPLPWTSIEGYKIWTINGGLAGLFVDLSKSYNIPECPRKSTAYFERKKHQLFLGLRYSMRVVDENAVAQAPKDDKLLEIFETWWHAGLARAELAQMGED